MQNNYRLRSNSAQVLSRLNTFKSSPSTQSQDFHFAFKIYELMRLIRMIFTLMLHVNEEDLERTLRENCENNFTSSA